MAKAKKKASRAKPTTGISGRKVRKYPGLTRAEVAHLQSKYDPKYCEQIVRLGMQGKTDAQFAAHFHVQIATVRVWWPKQHPEFAEAYQLARTMAQAYWEDRYSHLAEKGSRHDAARIGAQQFLLARRFRQDYHEKFMQEVKLPDGVTTRTIHSNMSPEESAKLYEEELKRRADEDT